MPTHKKPTKRYWLYAVDALILLVAVGLVIFGLQQSRKDDTAACTKPGKTHDVTVINETFSKARLDLTRCDTLRITNHDERTFEFAFGVHDKHIAYPGFTQSTVGPHETLTIRVTQAGEYHMHDHLRDRASIDLVIREK